MFKSIILVTTLSLLSLQSYAQQGPNIDQKLIRKSNRLVKVVDRNLDAMTKSEKKQVIKLINKAIAVARGDSSGGGHGGGAVIKFTLESSSFVIESSGSLSSAKAACVSAIKSASTGSVDDITATVGGVTKSLHTSGWWKTNSEKCQVVTALALQSASSAGQSLSSSRYVLSGSADGIGILAEGDSLSELKTSCVDLTSINSSVDDISVSLNGGPTKALHTSGWWRSSEEVCQNAVAIVF